MSAIDDFLDPKDPKKHQELTTWAPWVGLNSPLGIVRNMRAHALNGVLLIPVARIDTLAVTKVHLHMATGQFSLVAGLFILGFWM